MSNSLLSAAILALLINCASSLTIVGYFTDSNVTSHLRLDLDQTALNAAAQDYLFDTAYAAYSKGITTHSPHASHDMPGCALLCTYCMRRRVTSCSSGDR